ncbi:MAG: hypothetical protein LHW51_06435, partial [Candidatus Cloacimonetes bacterium]|nr:hypothetical protein [Candidatus Cloacimonadota bacterium]MCK9242781.1 hypothetical protein [Candidatus Cloacimonadota bacterium]
MRLASSKASGLKKDTYRALQTRRLQSSIVLLFPPVQTRRLQSSIVLLFPPVQTRRLQSSIVL